MLRASSTTSHSSLARSLRSLRPFPASSAPSLTPLRALASSSTVSAPRRPRFASNQPVAKGDEGPRLVGLQADYTPLDYSRLAQLPPGKELASNLRRFAAIEAKPLFLDVLQRPNPLINESGGLPDYKGTWVLATPKSPLEQAFVCTTPGTEVEAIRHVLACAGEEGPSIVLPSEAFGGSLVVAAKRREDGRKMLLSAQTDSSLSRYKAMESLRLPYHDLTHQAPELPYELAASYTDLHRMLREHQAKLSIMFAVLRFPLKTTGSATRISLNAYEPDVHVFQEDEKPIQWSDNVKSLELVVGLSDQGDIVVPKMDRLLPPLDEKDDVPLLTRGISRRTRL